MSGCNHSKEVECGPCGRSRKRATWTIRQGSLFSQKLHIIDTETGVSFNLTGFGARAALRYDKVEKGSPLAELTCTVITPAIGGWIRVRIGATKTRLLLDQGRFDVEIYKLDDPDIVYRVLEGKYVVAHEVTD